MAKRAKKITAKTPKQVERLEYRLRDIAISEFQMHDLSLYKKKENRDEEILSWTFQYNMFFSIDVSEIPHVLTLAIRTILMQQNVELATLGVATSFDVKGLEKLEDNTGAFTVPQPFKIGLISASIGTIRGILWTKFQGTKLSHVILPLVDPKHLSDNLTELVEAR